MEVLQWGFIIGLSLAILSVILTLYFLFSFISQGKKLKNLPSKQSKNKRKKKMQVKQMEQIKHGKSRALRYTILFTLLSMVFAGSSFYIMYYQSTNLSLEDTQNVSDGFYYIRDLQNELKAIQAGTFEKEKSKQTITFIATSLAGYSVKQANTLNTTEGQSILNKYYNAVSELGINLSRQAEELFSNEEMVNELLKDIDKVITYQTKMLNFYKINKTALEAG